MSSSRKGSRGRVPANAEKQPGGKELALQLNVAASELQAAYFTCVTVETALLGQDADQDKDIAFCLRLNVAEPLNRQVEKLRGLARRLIGTAGKTTEP